jgi:hypothetical protein
VSPPPAAMSPAPPPPCTCSGGTCTNGQCVCPANHYDCQGMGVCCQTGHGCRSTGCGECARRNVCEAGSIRFQQCGPVESEGIACGCANLGSGTACVNINQGECTACTPETDCTAGGQPGVCVDFSPCATCDGTVGTACFLIGDCAPAPPPPPPPPPPPTCTRGDICATGAIIVQPCSSAGCGCVNSGSGTACVETSLFRATCSNCTPETACTTTSGEAGVCVSLSACTSNPCAGSGGNVCAPTAGCP